MAQQLPIGGKWLLVTLFFPGMVRWRTLASKIPTPWPKSRNIRRIDDRRKDVLKPTSSKKRTWACAWLETCRGSETHMKSCIGTFLDSLWWLFNYKLSPEYRWLVPLSVRLHRRNAHEIALKDKRQCPSTMCLNIRKNDQSEAMQCHSTNVIGVVRFLRLHRSIHNCNRYHQQNLQFDEEPTKGGADPAPIRKQISWPGQSKRLLVEL